MKEKKIRKSPKEKIQESPSDKESDYVKYPREEIVEVSEIKKARFCRPSKDRIKSLYNAHNNRSYTSVHTHPYDPEEIKSNQDRKLKSLVLVPSDIDLRGFLLNDSLRTMAIAQRNEKTGQVEGYLVARKTKNTPKIGFSPLFDNEDYKNIHFRNGILSGVKSLYRTFKSFMGISSTAKKYGFVLKGAGITDEPEFIEQALEKISQKYHLKFRYVPAKGYALSQDKTLFINPPGNGNLESKVAGIIGILCLLISLYFLSINITGFIILDIKSSDYSMIGLISFLIGLVLTYFYFKKRSKI